MVDGNRVPAEADEGKEGIIFGFAAVLVFLFLAAQYELVIPLPLFLRCLSGMFGALVGVMPIGAYDVYAPNRHRDADRLAIERTPFHR
jgi:multidrug efflux pump subunit AcrB